MKTLRKCVECKRYTLSKNCPNCGAKAEYPYPMRFSLEKEVKYRKYIKKSR
ncbi:MAG: ribosome biogenesis protein [Methanobacteriota archaeon]|nr:MAG: ribosome biogenesis protein [Euryarchaeota archaeon]